MIEEPVGRLAGKAQRIEPIIPYYKAGDNEVLRQWDEQFVDRAGNVATLTKIHYKSKKKSTVNEAVIRVKWTQLFAYLNRPQSKP